MPTEMTDNKTENGYNFIDLSYLELMADGDEEMKGVMIDMLLIELPDELAKMSMELSAAEWETLGSTSHKMKSTLSFLGNKEMTAANQEIEVICKSGEGTERILAMIETMQEYTPRVIEELKIELSKF